MASWNYCSDCEFWLEYAPSYNVNGLSIGECHLNPPTVVSDDVPYWGHIMTHEDDFCSHAVVRKGLVD